MKKMPTRALDVAKYLIFMFSRRGESLTNLKLQKLLYYCQAWHIVHHDSLLFPETIEAWVHGPVVSSVFGEFKKYGWSAILEPVELSSLSISDTNRRHIDNVIESYGHLQARELEDLTHSEEPWRAARRNLAPDQPSRAVIDADQMGAFYKRQLANA